MSGSGGQGNVPVTNIAGVRIALGPVRRSDLPVYHRWINDFQVTRTLGARMGPVSHESEEAWYERVSAGQGDDVQFIIYELPSMRPIGGTGLHRVDLVHRTAEFGIMIGEKDAWGRGCGTEAAKLVLEYGFSVLGLNAVMLRVFSYNERAIHSYRRVGFKEAGRLREARRLGGKVYDVILMDCLASEFQGGALAHLLPEG